MRQSPVFPTVVPTGTAPEHFLAADLEVVFKRTFAHMGCELRGGAAEPLYTPGETADDIDLVHYTRDYFASALHEVAHWCIAGEARRRLVDYGYWYAPDGRTAAQQRAFEKAEIKPQALEWLFNLCCGHRFRISADNLRADMGASEQFESGVLRQARSYVRALTSGVAEDCDQGVLPLRGRHFALALTRFYARPLPTEVELELQS